MASDKGAGLLYEFLKNGRTISSCAELVRFIYEHKESFSDIPLPLVLELKKYTSRKGYFKLNENPSENLLTNYYLYQLFIHFEIKNNSLRRWLKSKGSIQKSETKAIKRKEKLRFNYKANILARLIIKWIANSPLGLESQYLVEYVYQKFVINSTLLSKKDIILKDIYTTLLYFTVYNFLLDNGFLKKESSIVQDFFARKFSLLSPLIVRTEKIMKNCYINKTINRTEVSYINSLPLRILRFHLGENTIPKHFENGFMRYVIEKQISDDLADFSNDLKRGKTTLVTKLIAQNHNIDLLDDYKIITESAIENLRQISIDFKEYDYYSKLLKSFEDSLNELNRAKKLYPYLYMRQV
ncbi:MAG: hypothetical protein Fur003_2460 [Candidatus Dojkabacteria bacterium]